MKMLKRLIFLTIILFLCNCCLADSNQIIVHINSRELQIIPPIESATSNALQRLIAQRIRRAIIDSAIQKAQITVPDNVLSNCMDLYLAAGGENPTNVVDVVSTRSAIVIQALRRVVIDHEDKDNVYSKYLSGSMTRSEWETWVKSYSTKEKIDKMESLVPHSVADLKRFSQDSLRRDIEVWLLFQKLTHDTSPSSEEIQLLYNKKYPTGIPSFAEVGDEIRAEATKQLKTEYLNKWWQTQLAESNVEVPIEFSGVKELIKTAPNLPFLPDSITTLLEKTN